MKSLRIFLVLSLLALFCSGSPLLAQYWSEPVAVTSGAGDDHHASIGLVMNQDYCLISWDRTEGGNTDIYARTFDPATGIVGDEVGVSLSDSVDEKPSVVEDAGPGNGVFYQSNESGRWAIHYAHLEQHSFWSPFMAIYSDGDLYEPKVRIDYASIPSPTVLCRSDSAAVLAWIDTYALLQGIAQYLPAENIYPVYSVDGYWTASMIPDIGALRWVWEAEIDGIHQIEYSYNLFLWPPQWVEGTIPNAGYQYHHPAAYWDVLYIERESASDFDLVRTFFDDTTGIWTFPDLFFESAGNEKNPYVKNGNLVFEVDWNGNWDIAFWHPNLGEPEVIDTDLAEDRNPLIVQGFYDNKLHAFWESNRDGNWKIFWSQRDVVGVQQEAKPALPDNLGLSVYPNPSNAAFRISLNPVGSGDVKAGIYDLSGRLVSEIYDGWLPKGLQSLYWDAAAIPSGMYLLRVESQRSAQIKKIVLLK